MRWFGFLPCVLLMACDAVPTNDVQTAQTRAIISNRDIAMNRPNTQTPEAVFRMFEDGTGTVEFLANPDGAQTVGWSLNGNRFCITASEGLMASFECATLSLQGAEVTLAHTASDHVATGTLIPR